MKKLIYISLALSIVACTQTVIEPMTEPEPEPEFAQWRGENRDGIYPDTNLMEQWPENGPTLLWFNDSIGNGYGSPAVVSDRLYINGEIDSLGYLFAFDLTGKLIWKTLYGREWADHYNGARSTPTVCGDKIYVSSGMGNIVCISDKGETLWSKNMVEDFHGVNNRFGYAQSLLIDDSMLFAAPGGPDTNVIALNRFTGDIIWTSKAMGKISAYCSPIIVKLPMRKILVTFSESQFLGIDATDGKLLWCQDQDTICDIHANTPVYHQGYLYYSAGCGNGTVKAELTAQGDSIKTVWSTYNIANYISGTVNVGERIYGACEKWKNWRALDAATGNLLDTLDFHKGTTIYADGMLYCYNDKGNMGLVYPGSDSLQLVSSFKIDHGTKEHFSHPVIKNGVLYIRHGMSVMAYDILEKPVAVKEAS